VATSGTIDNIPVDQVRRFESEFIQFVENTNAGILKTIAQKQALDDGIKADIKKAADAFKEQFMASIKEAAPATGEKEAKAAEAKASAAKPPVAAPAK